MPEVAVPNVKAKVNLKEYERGWGSQVYDTKYFDDWDEAVQYVRDFNSKNTEKEVPDYYTVAEGPYRI